MGYTTKFSGNFLVAPRMSVNVIDSIAKLYENDENVGPGGYCQWITRGSDAIAWDGQEKFYNYIEWLQYIIDEILAPNRLRLSGTVLWRGESFDDVGFIKAHGTVLEVHRADFKSIDRG